LLILSSGIAVFLFCNYASVVRSVELSKMDIRIGRGGYQGILLPSITANRRRRLDGVSTVRGASLKGDIVHLGYPLSVPCKLRNIRNIRHSIVSIKFFWTIKRHSIRNIRNNAGGLKLRRCGACGACVGWVRNTNCLKGTFTGSATIR
jgi:hypothetical protein